MGEFYTDKVIIGRLRKVIEEDFIEFKYKSVFVFNDGYFLLNSMGEQIPIYEGNLPIKVYNIKKSDNCDKISLTEINNNVAELNAKNEPEEGWIATKDLYFTSKWDRDMDTPLGAAIKGSEFLAKDVINNEMITIPTPDFILLDNFLDYFGIIPEYITKKEFTVLEAIYRENEVDRLTERHL